MSLGLAGLSLAGLVLMAVSFAVGLVESVDTFSDSWLLVAAGSGVLTSAVGAVAAGFVAARRGERTWSVTVATVLGVLLALVVLNEVAQGVW